MRQPVALVTAIAAAVCFPALMTSSGAAKTTSPRYVPLKISAGITTDPITVSFKWTVTSPPRYYLQVYVQFNCGSAGTQTAWRKVSARKGMRVITIRLRDTKKDAGSNQPMTPVPASWCRKSGQAGMNLDTPGACTPECTGLGGAQIPVTPRGFPTKMFKLTSAA
jgi:hypothetical protein